MLDAVRTWCERYGPHCDAVVRADAFVKVSMKSGWRKRDDYGRSQKELLGAMIRQAGAGGVLLAYGEDPVDDGLTGTWRRANQPRDTWVVPGDADAGEVLRWLFMGGWILCHRSEPGTVEKWPSLKSRNVEIIREEMRTLRIDTLMDAFHDNLEYDLYVSEE
jgi:hypothetical protein